MGELLAMQVNSGRRASFAQFRAMKQRRESMCIDDSKPHDGPSTQDVLNAAATAVATAAASTAAKLNHMFEPRRRRRSSCADFAKFRAMKQRRTSMCIDDSKDHDGPSTAEMLALHAVPEEPASPAPLTMDVVAIAPRTKSKAKARKRKSKRPRKRPASYWKTKKASHKKASARKVKRADRAAAAARKASKASRAAAATRPPRRESKKMDPEPTLTRYNLSKLTNRRGEDQDPKEADQFILVERNSPGMPSYSKMTYVLNSTVVCAFYVDGDSTDAEVRFHGPNASDDCGYTLKLSDMPKLKPIYNCASSNVRGYEMTFPNMPQFLALFEEDSRRIFDWQNLQDFGGPAIFVQESFQSVHQRLGQRLS